VSIGKLQLSVPPAFYRTTGPSSAGREEGKFKNFLPRRALRECCPRAPQWLSTSLLYDATASERLPIGGRPQMPSR